MSKQIRAGEKEQAKGKIREGVGKLSGKKREEIRGKLEQVGGKARTKLGKAVKKM
ncbi:MAG: CsbD family protein [Nitrososphaerales archaeon]